MGMALETEVVSRLPHQPTSPIANGKTGVAPSRDVAAPEWKRCIDKLLEIRLLDDDWDGQAAESPPAELVDIAIILAVLLRQIRIEPPCRTVPTVTGGVVLEWQWPDATTLEIEVTEPFMADLFLLVPERPAERWQIRGSNEAFLENGASICC